MKCELCGCDTFKIEKCNDCTSCEFNGAWCEEDNKYIYDSVLVEKNKYERDEVFESGVCAIGISFNEGCHLNICTNCENITNFPWCD